MLKSLVCPISTLRVKHNVVRITGFLMASLIALFALTGNPIFLALCVVDYAIRAFTALPFSPFSRLADWLAGAFKLSNEYIDKAPKIFAARAGFLFALSAFALATLGSSFGLVVALTLMSLALLESLLDLCLGCLVYTYIAFPLLGNYAKGAPNKVR